MKMEKEHITPHFHLQLVMKIEEFSRYPFTKLVIDHNLTEFEYTDTLELLNVLNEKMMEEKAEGLIHYEPLLLHFAGMLCYKLPVEDTIDALSEEGIYPGLMEVLKENKNKQ